MENLTKRVEALEDQVSKCIAFDYKIKAGLTELLIKMREIETLTGGKANGNKGASSIKTS